MPDSMKDKGGSSAFAVPDGKSLTGKAGIRAFFLANLGKVVSTEQVREASGNQVQYSRRLRELRDEEGWRIQSHHDSSDLSPGQYRLAESPPETPPLGFARNISATTRARVLDRNGNTCRMCGIAAGDLDDRTGRPARLHVGHIVDKSRGGSDDESNLRTLCSTCNQGAKNLTQEPPSFGWLIAQVRRAREGDQRQVLEWLRNKFKE